MYDQLVNLISSVGFPIAVSVYLLTRFESKIDLLIKSIEGLRVDMAAVIKNQEKKQD
ncbi:YvrJ family protein [Clostridiaceae bacterium UIB06]|uniref:YvrJ family protein n=1 Tax=Clostridium thailandense TaxID=2794346 RepID=A0A949WTM0_9CLOT|nr:YvrJ family protein [Clostridium thailandense]MBV7271627.1 YvrJ family protein [Clostridium thailandense]MCH5136403.1 YvrJ family protein [Clostridiaceae bacterium UIB06]